MARIEQAKPFSVSASNSVSALFYAGLVDVASRSCHARSIPVCCSITETFTEAFKRLVLMRVTQQLYP